MTRFQNIMIAFIVSTATYSVGVAATFLTEVKCNAPVIIPDNFHQYVTILVGSNRTFSCIIYSDTPLKEGYPKWTKPEPFPDHVKTTGECPTLSNTACSNLTLINVSQSDGTGYYTITAENECGSNNFTVYVLVMNPHPCLNATELPPLLNPPPPNIRAVEGQSVTVTATYKGDYYLDSLGAMYGIKTANNKKYKYITPDDTPSSGYNVTVDDECPVTNISCCHFNVSISVGPVTLATSDIELKSAAVRSDDWTHYNSGHSSIRVYKTPTIVEFPDSACENLTTSHSTKFSCTYNASSDPNITIAMWSVNGTLLTHNTSHYTMITEYGIDEHDQVRSTLTISNVNHDIGGTYTCWCEYNKSLIYGNEMYRSSSAGTCLRVVTGSRHSPTTRWEIILTVAGIVTGLFFALIIMLLICCCCCYCKGKGKHDTNPTIQEQDVDDETRPLLNGEATSSRALEQSNSLQNVVESEDSARENDSLEVSPSSQHHQEIDTFEIDGSKEPPHVQVHSESANPPTTVSAPSSRDGRTTAQEEPQPSGTNADDEVTNGNVTVRAAQPHIKRLSTTKPIDSEREVPISEEPAKTVLVSQDTLVAPTTEFDTTNKVLNDVAVEFTTLLNLDTLLPYLLKHGLLTNDELFDCQSHNIPSSKRAQKLLQLLKHKGNGVLQKLLCCLNEETAHSGHKDITSKLICVMKLHNLIFVCPVCKQLPKAMLTNQRPDVLDDMFAVITANCPAEKWEELASVLGISEHVIEQIRISMTDSTQSVTMVLEQWRQVHLKATTKELAATLHNSNLRYILQ